MMISIRVSLYSADFFTSLRHSNRSKNYEMQGFQVLNDVNCVNTIVIFETLSIAW